jgi:hypothetical protein
VAAKHPAEKGPKRPRQQSIRQGSRHDDSGKASARAKTTAAKYQPESNRSGKVSSMKAEQWWQSNQQKLQWQRIRSARTCNIGRKATTRKD